MSRQYTKKKKQMTNSEMRDIQYLYSLEKIQRKAI